MNIFTKIKNKLTKKAINPVVKTDCFVDTFYEKPADIFKPKRIKAAKENALTNMHKRYLIELLNIFSHSGEKGGKSYIYKHEVSLTAKQLIKGGFARQKGTKVIITKKGRIAANKLRTR